MVNNLIIVQRGAGIKGEDAARRGLFTINAHWRPWFHHLGYDVWLHSKSTVRILLTRRDLIGQNKQVGPRTNEFSRGMFWSQTNLNWLRHGVVLPGFKWAVLTIKFKPTNHVMPFFTHAYANPNPNPNPTLFSHLKSLFSHFVLKFH